MTVTAPPFSFEMNASAPSAVKTIDRGRSAVLIRATTLNVAVSTATTSLSPSQLTYTTLPSGRIIGPPELPDRTTARTV